MHRRCPLREGYVIPAYKIQENETKDYGKREQESYLDVATTIKSMRENLQGCKEENKMMIKALVEKN